MKEDLADISDRLATHTFSHGGIDEVCLIAPADPGRLDESAIAPLREELRRSFGAQVIRENLFGVPCAVASSRSIFQPAPGHCWPVTSLTRGVQLAEPAVSVCLQALNGTQPTPIRIGKRIVGVTYEDAYARYCLLGNLQPEETDVSRGDQTTQTFELMETALDRAGMDFSNVVRTWFYLDRILDWYDEFNVARSRFFKERGVFDRLVPASTGVGLGNPTRCALMAEAFAVKPKDPRVLIQAVPSPLQCPALAYGSSFSRAVEIAAPDHKRLLISGTASIAADGSNAHLGDVKAQIVFTLQVVEAILKSRGMDWSHTSRAVAYFKRAEDMGALASLTDNALQGLPMAVVHADVCRDELLFELELDAIHLSF